MNAKNFPGPWEIAVAAEINAERAAQDVPVHELAERAGVHPGSMPRYMKGRRQMNLGLVEKFAEALGVDVWVLIRRADERVRKASGENPQDVSDGLDG